MEPQNKESSEPWMVALLTMVAVELLKPEMAWWPWIRRLTTAEFKQMLIRILSTLDLNQAMREVMLNLLGTTAGEMTEMELQTWAKWILLARNRALAIRETIQPVRPSPDSPRE